MDEKENWEVGDACFLANYFAVRKNDTGTLPLGWGRYLSCDA